MNLQGSGGTHDWVEVCCTVVEQVVESQYVAVEDKAADPGSMAVEDIGGVAAVVSGRCSAVGPDSIHWP